MMPQAGQRGGSAKSTISRARLRTADAASDMPHPVAARTRRQEAVRQCGPGITLAGAVGGTPVAAGCEVPGGWAERAHKKSAATTTSRMTSSRMPLPPVGRHGGLVLMSAPSPVARSKPVAKQAVAGRADFSARPRGSSEIAQQPEDEHDDQDDAEAARRI